MKQERLEVAHRLVGSETIMIGRETRMVGSGAAVDGKWNTTGWK